LHPLLQALHPEVQSVVALEKNQDLNTLPILFLDVNLGKNKSSRIVVFDGDDPKEVTEKFAKVHNLDKKKTEKLLGVVRLQVAAILPKISETEEEP
jgi:hypothetical protein